MKRLLIYDASETKPVGWTWKVAAYLFQSHFHTVLAVKSIEDCIQKLAGISNSSFDEIQFWCHGSPGKLLINKKADTDKFWSAFWTATHSSTILWLRCCSFAAGDIGKKKMMRLGRHFNLPIAAFTHVIGSWGVQSGLKLLKPHEEPGWSDSEGFEQNGKLSESRPWLPDTILATQMSFPKKYL